MGRDYTLLPTSGPDFFSLLLSFTVASVQAFILSSGPVQAFSAGLLASDLSLFPSVIHMTSRMILDGGLAHTPALPAESSSSSSHAFKAFGSLTLPKLSSHKFPGPREAG